MISRPEIQRNSVVYNSYLDFSHSVPDVGDISAATSQTLCETNSLRTESGFEDDRTMALQTILVPSSCQLVKNRYSLDIWARFYH